MAAIDHKKENYRNLARTLIPRFEKRNMTAEYCETAADALSRVKAIIPEGASCACGGSETLKDSGIFAMLKEGPYQYFDRYAGKDEAETAALYKEINAVDYYLMSTNAFTANGELVNIDGTANRVSSLCHGPKHVLVVAGMNKFARSVDGAFERVRNVAAPANCIRLGLDTPCAKTGVCADCQAEWCICCQMVVTRRSMIKDRIHIILVGEDLGL